MKQKQTKLAENSDAVELLILGNSHAGDGLAPTPFDLHAFNTAQGFQSLYFDIAITKKYLAKMTRLKYVLISIDYHSLYIPHDPSRDFMYSYYYDIDYPGTGSFKSNISLLFYGYGIKNGLSMILERPHELVKGWTGFKTTNYAELTREAGKRRVGLFNDMIKNDMHNRSEILKQLNAFIFLLKSKNIAPVLFTLPCHKYYTEYLDATIVAQNHEDIKTLCNRYNIEYFNFLYEKLPDDYFYNVDHLNEKGAWAFGNIINDSISMLKARK
jgi:hypothetical protein